MKKAEKIKFEEIIEYYYIKTLCLQIDIRKIEEIYDRYGIYYDGSYEEWVKHLDVKKFCEMYKDINVFFNDCKKYLGLEKEILCKNIKFLCIG